MVNFKAPGILSRAVVDLEDPNILLKIKLLNFDSIIAELGIALQVASDMEKFLNSFIGTHLV